MNEITQTHRRGGRSPLGRFHKFVIRVTPAMADELRTNAREDGTTMNDLICQRLRATSTRQTKTPSMRELSTANALDEAASKTEEALNAQQSIPI